MQSCSIWAVQERLNQAEAYPILGPLLVSPIKALISLVQAVVYILFALILLLIAGCFFAKKPICKEFSQASYHAFAYSTYALTSCGKSAVNFLTLGLIHLFV